jgi:RecA/RadA recombinase
MAKKKIVRKKVIRKKTPSRATVSRATVPSRESEEDGEPDPIQELIEDAQEELLEETIEQEQYTPHRYDLAGNAERGRSRIHDICEQMGTQWGVHTAMPMSMATVVNIKRMPIGIIEFDYRTGGGLVLGRCNRLQGKKDTLKSTTCLKALAAAQRNCRHCKWPIVVDPESGRINCHCPEHRFWVGDETDYAWLPQHAALSLHAGQLPDGWEYQSIKGMGRVPVLVCDPPPHMKGKKGIKRRPVPFAEEYRCEPMRTCLYDTENTTDRMWAEANNVDPSLVGYTNAKWAEQGLESVERMALTREFDLVIIDSTSMMETREHLEDRKVGERGTPAGKQKLMGDFIKRIVAAQVEGGVAGRYSPTLLTTSHLTTKGMGHGQHTHLGPTDGLTVSHGVAMDIKLRAEKFVMDKDKQRSIYGVFEFTIDKNHCGGMGSTKTKGQIKYWLVDTPDHPVGDANDLATVIDYSRSFGAPFVSEGTGKAKVTLHSEMISGGRRPFRTLGAMTGYLREHGGVFQELRQRVLEKLIEDRALLHVSETEEPTE